MRFSASHVFKRPGAAVLASLSDPARLEDALLDLGAQFQRRPCAQGAEWQCALPWRGANRAFVVTMIPSVPGRGVTLALRGDLADATIEFLVDDLPDGGCQAQAQADVTAHRMMARIALRSMAMVRGRLETRLERLIQALGRP